MTRKVLDSFFKLWVPYFGDLLFENIFLLGAENSVIYFRILVEDGLNFPVFGFSTLGSF